MMLNKRGKMPVGTTAASADHAVAAEAVGILQEFYGRMAKMPPAKRS